MRELPEALRDDWVKAYEFLFVNLPSPVYVGDIERLQSRAGITDRLVVAVMEQALKKKRINVMSWTRTVLQEMVPYGVRTVEEWDAFEKERQVVDQEQSAAVQAQKKPRNQKESNVFLHREKKPDGYYDDVFHKFPEE